jgi:hypothetical protein
MPSDQNPLDDAADPSEDNPGDEGEDKAQDDTDTGPVDWEAQYLEAQKAISRQGAELALLRRGESSDDDAEALGEDAPDDSSYVAILEQQSWDLARATYGDAAMDAYEAFYQSNRTAQTPSDHIAALEAYYDVRSGQAAALAAASADKTVEPSQARIDTNRSDPSPDLTETFAEARKSGKLEDFTKAASAALGFGSNKR